MKFEDSQNRFKNFRKSVNPKPVYQNIESQKTQNNSDLNDQIEAAKPLTFIEKHKALEKLQKFTAQQQLSRLDQSLQKKVDNSFLADKQERDIMKA